jgi:uroporphyrinogen-III synthase
MTHVLVTRPLEKSRQLADQLKAHGLTPIVMPFYTFSPRDPLPGLRSSWSQGRSRKLAVFTSPRAVQFGLPFMPEPGELNGIEIAVVGSTTRASLEASTYPVHLQANSGFTSEDLLQINALADDPGVAVIFCAPGGRKTLAEGLVKLGWQTIEAMVYERVPLQPGPGQFESLRNCGDMISVWTSISAIDIAEKSLPGDVWVKILGSSALVISSRIQRHLVKLGANRVELADGPGNSELLRSILRLKGEQAAG